MTLVQPFAVFADVMTSSNAFVVNPDYLIGSASNADPYGIATMDLTDEDYLIQPFNSIQTVTNTVNYDGAYAIFYCEDTLNDRMVTVADPISSDGKASWVVPVGYKVSRYGIRLFKKNLPVSGNYSMQLSYSADTSFSYNRVRVSSARTNQNASSSTDSFDVPYEQASGDFYFETIVDLGSISYMSIFAWLPEPAVSGQLIAGYYDINFTLSSADPDYSTVGAGMAESDYQSDISNQMSNISSSLDSAADNLEYISTSQNLIIQGIDNVIMHISDQLYAFWDQLYNLIHEPTYARLGDILDALKAIANNSDIYAVVETIEESSEKQTADIIANNNANTSKVESAVEKHGNFIIEGLKGLFIPSDEYFKTYFDDLYGYFSERFGFLSFPIDLLVRLVDLFANSSERDCILTLPSFEISGEQLITEASFNLTEFMENDFSLVLSSIRMVTSIGLIMAFVHLCQTKWNEVMRN